jgi:hypothetical protein
MEFHVSREIRNQTGVDDLLFNYAGNVIFGDLSASRKFVAKYNAALGSKGSTGPVLHAAALFAMGLIDELNHAMIAKYRETLDPDLLPHALGWLEAEANREPVDRLLVAFSDEFPVVRVYRGQQTASGWLASITPAAEANAKKDIPNREVALEELLMLWLANRNPAFQPFKPLFDDRALEEKTIYNQVKAGLPEFFASRPQLPAFNGSLLDALLAPMLASPDSLSGQLAYMRDHWAEHLGPEFSESLRRTLLAVDVLREEDIAIWTMYHPPSGQHRFGEEKWSAQGFDGDEFVGFEEAARRRRVRAGQQEPQPLNEYEAFSPDQAWMPTVVMIAKSTYVWLEQLSKKYKWHIHRLDHIPGEELELLASRGINALWLIGLWERSTASQTIKRLMGQHDAVASAYSLKDYRIAEDLGGTWAYEQLRSNAARYGIRLASDMVPNHMGIDSTWVMEHPEWFLSRWESPFPVYSFEGPDLSTESRFEIKIDDHYYNQSDAAVVFRLRERSNGATRFVYHGNDGTTFAWNDTAQLDYSKAFVREQVIQTILQVAKLFPIIRFDAAMTLAKKHVQRLWFPLPGIGGSIPSRAESAVKQEEFDAMMPNEFWREVVDRVAVEVPGTLLLAEAFWLLEGYFVRTLGMHRVYNSAFMNMLRDEENGKYRSYLKKTIEFDPEILKRYVNFMSNPDEKTAIDQFGTGDKYFGTCTMLATIPGLPMIGHGQIEAFTEKYGMEYKKARYEEWPNEDLVARHMREIAPLLKNRQLFAESYNFVMYDYWVGEGNVNENVFAYSNRVDHGGDGYGGSGKERALVLYNNAYQSTFGTIHLSVADMDKFTGQLRQRTLRQALELPSEPGVFLAWRDSASNLEYLRGSSDLDESGFSIGLRGYQYAVLLDWRELRATAEKPWDELAGALHGGGVYSLEEALKELRLKPMHEALQEAVALEVLTAFDAISAPARETAVKADDAGMEPAEVEEQAETACDPRLVEFCNRAAHFFWESKQVEASIASSVPDLAPWAGDTAEKRQFLATANACAHFPTLVARLASPLTEPAKKVLPSSLDLYGHTGSGQAWAPTLAWLLIESLAPSTAEGGANAAALFDRLHLRTALADAFSSLGAERQTAWRIAARVRLLLANPAVDSLEALGAPALWEDPDVRWFAGLTESEGVTYANKECFEELVWWLQLPRLLEAARPGGAGLEAIEAVIAEAAAAAREAGYDLAKLLVLLRAKSVTKVATMTETLPVAAAVDEAVGDEPVVETEDAETPVAVKV